MWWIVGSDSESLQDDSVVGNISKYSVVTPGYAGPIKRGHLIFNADFECGEYMICCSSDILYIFLYADMCYIMSCSFFHTGHCMKQI